MAKKQDSSRAKAIKRFLHRGHNQELAGQTKLKHYRETLGIHTICECCERERALHRHRIVPNGEYNETGNVYWCCALCHKLIHHIYDRTKAATELEYRIAIMVAEETIRQEIKKEKR